MLKDFFRFLRQISIISDVLTTVGSFIAAYFIRLLILEIIPFGGPTELTDYWEFILVIIFLWWWIFSLQGAYTSGRFTSLFQEIKAAFKTVFFGTLVLLSTAFLLKLYFPPRSLIIIFSRVYKFPCLPSRSHNYDQFSMVAFSSETVYQIVNCHFLQRQEKRIYSGKDYD